MASTNAEALARDLARSSAIPYPGRWSSPPFDGRRVGGRVFTLVNVDLDLRAIGVDQSEGSVRPLPDDEEPGLINSTVAALVSCSKAYSRAAAEAAELEAAGVSEKLQRFIDT